MRSVSHAVRNALPLVLLLVSGCAPSYEVREATDQFSDPGQPASYALKSNPIQIGIGALVPWPDELNPYADRDRKTGKITGVGFSAALTNAGLADQMMILRGDPITFLADGQRISTPAVVGRLDYGMDSGIYAVTPEQFRQIAFAADLQFRVDGHRQSRTYPAGNFRLLDSFRANLRRFYSEQIEPFL